MVQSTTGMLVGEFQGRYGPKEIGAARAARDQALQKRCLPVATSRRKLSRTVRLLARKMEERRWQYIFARGEGEATGAAGVGTFDYSLMTSVMEQLKSPQPCPPVSLICNSAQQPSSMSGPQMKSARTFRLYLLTCCIQ